MSRLARRIAAANRFPGVAAARDIRLRAGVSQEDVAAELGVHRVTVARWEAGARQPRRHHRIAYANLLAELERLAPPQPPAGVSDKDAQG